MRAGVSTHSLCAKYSSWCALAQVDDAPAVEARGGARRGRRSASARRPAGADAPRRGRARRARAVERIERRRRRRLGQQRAAAADAAAPAARPAARRSAGARRQGGSWRARAWRRLRPALRAPAPRPNSRPAGLRSVCSLRRRSEADSVAQLAQQALQFGQGLGAEALHVGADRSRPSCPRCALASAASLPIFSTASALRPMRSITGPSLRRRRAALLSKVRAALAMPASIVSLRAASVRDTAAMSASALLKARAVFVAEHGVDVARRAVELGQHGGQHVLQPRAQRGLGADHRVARPARSRAAAAQSRAPPLSST